MIPEGSLLSLCRLILVIKAPTCDSLLMVFGAFGLQGFKLRIPNLNPKP